MKKYFSLGMLLLLVLANSCSNGSSPSSAAPKAQRFEINPAELPQHAARNPANPDAIPPGLNIVDGPNGNTAAQATAQYLAQAILSQSDGSGSVEVSERQADGSYSVISGLTSSDCPARGSNINQFSAGRVQTPKGLHSVKATAKYAVFQHAYDVGAAWAWGVFFSAVNGNPIGIHGGPLGDISHACIRVPPACSQKIRQLVRTQNPSPPPAAPSWMPSDSVGAAEGADESIMQVYVQWN